MNITFFKKKPSGLEKTLPYILLIGGLIGFLAAFILAVEKVQILKDPSFEPSCNINPVLSCGSVMVTDQAEAFGFPNPFLGIAGFAAVTAIGAALLAGARFKKWFWLLVQAGMIFAVGFIHWLFFQSVYRIGALCPYCMVVWSVTIPMFWYVTLYNVHQGYLCKGKTLKRIAGFARRHHGDILTLWFIVIIGLILKRFWYYWSTLI